MVDSRPSSICLVLAIRGPSANRRPAPYRRSVHLCFRSNRLLLFTDMDAVTSAGSTYAGHSSGTDCSSRTSRIPRDHLRNVSRSMRPMVRPSHAKKRRKPCRSKTGAATPPVGYYRRSTRAHQHGRAITRAPGSIHKRGGKRSAKPVTSTNQRTAYNTETANHTNGSKAREFVTTDNCLPIIGRPNSSTTGRTGWGFSGILVWRPTPTAMPCSGSK